VAVRVIDGLEAVDVEEEGDQRTPGPGGLLQGLLGQEHERPPVVEAGDVVDEGQLPQELFEAAALRDVVHPGDDLLEGLEGVAEPLVGFASVKLVPFPHRDTLYQTGESGIEGVARPFAGRSRCGTLE
jgi:hypothetical protein